MLYIDSARFGCDIANFKGKPDGYDGDDSYDGNDDYVCIQRTRICPSLYKQYVVPYNSGVKIKINNCLR